MKNYLILFFVFFLSCTVKAQNNKGINFQSGSFKEMLTKAKSENKLIFIDCYTSWCGPCKVMDKEVFTNDSVGQFYNSHFISIKIDIEKGEGPELGENYEVNCFPTFLFIDYNGKLVHRVSDKHSVKEFIKIGISAINPQKQFATYKAKYEAGAINNKELLEYLYLLKGSCLPVNNEIKKYFTPMQEIEYSNRTSWSIMDEFKIDINSPVFQYLSNNRNIFYEIYGKDSVNKVIGKVYENEMQKYIYEENIDTVRYKELRKNINELELSDLQSVTNLDLQFYQRMQNWPQYVTVAKYFVEHYAFDNYEIMSTITFPFIDFINDPKSLEMAAEWAKCSIDLKTDFLSTHTYAYLLYKTGNKSEAKKWAKKSLSLLKEESGENPDKRTLLNMKGLEDFIKKIDETK